MEYLPLIAGVLASILAISNLVFLISKYKDENEISFHLKRNLKSLFRESKNYVLPFSAIRYHIGGFSDSQLRKALVKCGYIRLCDVNRIECWTKRRLRDVFLCRNVLNVQIDAIGQEPPIQFESEYDV